MGTIVLFFKNFKVKCLSWAHTQKTKLRERVAKTFYSKLEDKIVVLKEKIEEQATADAEASAKMAEELSRVKIMLTPEVIQKAKDPNCYQFNDPGLTVRIEKTPNKDNLVFHLSDPILDTVSAIHGRSFIWPKGETAHSVPPTTDELLVWNRIGSTKKCAEMKVKAFCIEIIKPGAETWEYLIPIFLEKIQEIFKERLNV